MIRSLILALVAVSWAAPAAAQIPPGTWANPQRSVHVTFRRCGEAMCGTVVWANAKARADAAAGGTPRLVGERLFDGFVEEDEGLWSGEVFVPDLGRSVTGTITRTGPRTLVGEGCLFAGFGCKQQVWTRVK